MIDRYLDEGIALDYWWMDAGWYPCKGSWVNTGTWEVDRSQFPGGLRAVSDHARKRGVRTIVWFEPERVTSGSWLYENHPEWLLMPPESEDGVRHGSCLLNLGDPEARHWVTEHIDQLLVSEGIDLYRQDFNLDPLAFWRANDAPDRQGISEIRYVTGYLAFWDELRRRHPDMLIDSCASGGRRNDLETLRRGVPLLRSDYTFVPYSDQCQTYGLAFWVPYYGTGILEPDPAKIPYYFRSQMCPHLTVGWDTRRDDLPYALIKKLVDQWRGFAHCFLGDYYPLTSYSLEQDVWMAWQFDRPDLDEGIVQVFRREASPYESATFRLRALDPAAEYVVADLDGGQPRQVAGRALLEQGLPVAIGERPKAVVITYRRA
jgi:alpha-galactosidase